MEIKNLCINSDLVDAFNIGFSDFIVKIPYMTKDQFIKRMVNENNTNIEYSSICIDSNKVIGFSLLGVRDDYAMINSFCVINEFRGSGAASMLMKETLIKVGDREVYLEVVKENIRAINFYKKMGFFIYKDIIYILGVYTGSLKKLHGSIRELKIDELIKFQNRIDVPLAWNNNLFCVFKQKFKALGYFRGDELCGIITYIDNNSVNIRQIYVINEERRKGIASKLIVKALSGRPFSCLFIKNGIGENFFDSVSKYNYVDLYLMKSFN